MDSTKVNKENFQHCCNEEDSERCCCNMPCVCFRPCCCNTLEQSLSDAIEAIALSEAAMANILNTEAGKIESAADPSANIDDFLEVNDSVNKIINNAINLEQSYIQNLDLLNDLYKMSQIDSQNQNNSDTSIAPEDQNNSDTGTAPEDQNNSDTGTAPEDQNNSDTSIAPEAPMPCCHSSRCHSSRCHTSRCFESMDCEPQKKQFPCFEPMPCKAYYNKPPHFEPKPSEPCLNETPRFNKRLCDSCRAEYIPNTNHFDSESEPITCIPDEIKIPFLKLKSCTTTFLAEPGCSWISGTAMKFRINTYYGNSVALGGEKADSLILLPPARKYKIEYDIELVNKNSTSVNIVMRLHQKNELLQTKELFAGSNKIKLKESDVFVFETPANDDTCTLSLWLLSSSSLRITCGEIIVSEITS